MSTESKRLWRERNPERSRTYEAERASRRRWESGTPAYESYQRYESSIRRMMQRALYSRIVGNAGFARYTGALTDDEYEATFKSRAAAARAAL
jgi:hypothetical protein